MPKKSRLRCYFGCKNNGPLHLFPIPNTGSLDSLEKFKIWKSVLPLSIQERGDNYIYNSIRLCNNHFMDVYYLPSHRLTKNAVPTLCLEQQGQPSEELLVQQQTNPDFVQRSVALTEALDESREERGSEGPVVQ